MTFTTAGWYQGNHNTMFHYEATVSWSAVGQIAFHRREPGPTKPMTGGLYFCSGMCA